MNYLFHVFLQCGPLLIFRLNTENFESFLIYMIYIKMWGKVFHEKVKFNRDKFKLINLKSSANLCKYYRKYLKVNI